MSRRNYVVKLDTARVKTNKDLLFYISDLQSDRFTIKVTEKGQVLDLSNHVCAMIGISPSNKVSAQFITEQESNVLTIVLQKHMMNEIGQWKGRIVIFNEEQTLILDTFGYIVQQDELAQIDTDVQEDDRTPILTDLINQCRAIIEVEAARVITEQNRVNAEIQRVNQEQARVEAEQQRANEYKEITTDLSNMQQEFDDFILECQNSIDEAINRINSTDEQVKTNEQGRQQAENIRQNNEEERINNELNRQQVEAERVLAEQERSNNYSIIVEAEEERKQQAIQHQQAEQGRVQAETNRVNEEAKRRTTEQARVSAENTRVSNENTRETNEEARQNNETQRVEAETQRQNRYNSFISDAEKVANDFEAYTNSAKASEEERKASELDRKLQEDRRASNEVERISNENTRKANEVVREENETYRQNTFANKVNEVDEKISELNTTKDNFVSSINTKVDNKISEIEVAKSDMTNTVTNKIDEVETRFNTLTSKQQQDAEVIDARDGETSLKARLDRDIEKANKELDKIKKLEESTVSTVTTESDFTTVEATSNGYFEDVKLEGKTLVNLVQLNNLYYKKGIANISVGADLSTTIQSGLNSRGSRCTFKVDVKPNTKYTVMHCNNNISNDHSIVHTSNNVIVEPRASWTQDNLITTNSATDTIWVHLRVDSNNTEFTSIDQLNNHLLILEGDHTQNPPSYFEGLKSVGDGVDEIVVSSVNSDNTKSDKKRLLYYNNETQTWEKPILRQWDSIEKHSDGKYYYHQRSAEIVLNGSESWNSGTEQNTTIRYQFTLNNIKLSSNLLCDKFKQIPGGTDSEGVSNHASNNMLQLTLNKDKGNVKQWLQTNPTTVVYQLAQEKVYECTNIDLITYANETNYIVECEAIVPKSTLKVLQNATNIIRELQQKVSILEQNESKFMQILRDLINE